MKRFVFFAMLLGSIESCFSSAIEPPLIRFDDDQQRYWLSSMVLPSSEGFCPDYQDQLNRFLQENQDSDISHEVLNAYMWLYKELLNGWYATEYRGCNENEKSATQAYLVYAIQKLSA